MTDNEPPQPDRLHEPTTKSSSRLPDLVDDDDPVEGELIEDVITRLSASGHHPLERQDLAQVLQSVSYTRSVRHSGPLPTPSDLRQYDGIISNGAERIMQLAEREQMHRHELEKREQSLIERAEQHDFTVTTRGQRYGLAICLLIILVAVVLAFFGHERLAGALVIVDLASLAAVFVAGRYLPGRSTSSGVEQDADESNGAPNRTDQAELES